MKKAAIGICFNEKREVLLIKRSDVPLWALPGGGIEHGETPEESVVRELLEEANVVVGVSRKVAEYSPKNWMTGYTYLFECFQKEMGAPSPGDEALEAKFFPVDDLPKLFFFLHKEWLEDALKNEKETIFRTIDSMNWKSAFLFLLSHPLLSIRYLIARAGLPINSAANYYSSVHVLSPDDAGSWDKNGFRTRRGGEQEGLKTLPETPRQSDKVIFPRDPL